MPQSMDRSLIASTTRARRVTREEIVNLKIKSEPKGIKSWFRGVGNVFKSIGHMFSVGPKSKTNSRLQSIWACNAASQLACR